MPNVAEPTAPTDPAAHHGFVVDAPADVGDPFTVRVPDFDDLHVFEIRRWEDRGGQLPAEGDRVLVIVDDDAEPWAAAWWPSAGPSPDSIATAGIGMIIPGSERWTARGTAFAHYVWVGTAEPENAAEYDQWIKPE